MMDTQGKKLATVALLGLAGYVAYQYATATNATNASLGGTLQTIFENAGNAMGLTNWETTGEGATYVPICNAVESALGIPSNLLARMAYQESHFRQDIISGATVSAAGAVGIMQLEPQYFPGAGKSPSADIQTAGEYLVSLYNEFGDWQVAVAAYDWGPGNMKKYLAGTLSPMPSETQNYVTGVFADVPISGSLIQSA